MEKIKTIFERDWEGNRGVIATYAAGVDPDVLACATPYEKLDGTNVRLTVRNHTLVRLEKRRNPDKIQKKFGITEPWYTDASEGAEDRYIWEAARNTALSDIGDGEWSAEAIGPKIQGNPLNLEKRICVIFSCYQAPIFRDAPITFSELREWLPKQKSQVGNDCLIEGIVWHRLGKMYKIKQKDFK